MYSKYIKTIGPKGQAINTDDVIKFYFNGLSEANGANVYRRQISLAIGDLNIGCPTIQFGKGIHKGDSKASVYQYYYTSKLGEPKLFCAEWAGSCHFDDIYPVFGQPFLDYDRYVEREREISRQMIDTFATFATTGRPSPQNGSQWHPFYTIDANIIAPYYEFSSHPKVNTNFGHNLKHIECELLWKRYLVN